MVQDGYLYGFGFAFVAALLWVFTQVLWLSLAPLLLTAFFLWFFRDPQREVPTGAGVVVSPADGKVTDAEWIETTSGSRLRLSIFLNVFDVHVNRCPVSGTVRMVEYRKGGFINAMDPDSGLTNEQTLITIDTGEYQVIFKQIAGLLARRIVCNLKVGDRVRRGQRMGMIKFGSRTDVLLPAEATLNVKVGQRVKGGSSILGVVPQSNGRPAGEAGVS